MVFAFRKLSINGVTLHSVVAKVFERIVYDQLYAYLEEQSIICKYKSVFALLIQMLRPSLKPLTLWRIILIVEKPTLSFFLI